MPEVDADIAHLDFEPYEEPVVVTKEEPERAKECEIRANLPLDPEKHQCRRPAYVLISIKDKPCCHRSIDMYICKGHWAEYLKNPKSHVLQCGGCLVKYVLGDYMTRWERL